MDGSTGKSTINPTADVRRNSSVKTPFNKNADVRPKPVAQQPGTTLDGVRIAVLANVGNAADSAAAAVNGADGVGLLRTEFLSCVAPPGSNEDEQVRALQEIYAPIVGPVIVRTLDVGADKPLPFLPQAEEHNPYLGVRGIRLSLQSPDLFLPHLRAILRSAAEGTTSG